MKQEIERRHVVGGLVVRANKIVLVQEKKKEIRGLWNLPIGGLEDQELIIKGCVREMEEESGYKVKPYKFLGLYYNPDREGKMVFKYIIVARVIGGKLTCPDDLMDVREFTKQEYRKIPKNKFRDASVPMAIDDFFARRWYSLDVIRYYK